MFITFENPVEMKRVNAFTPNMKKVSQQGGTYITATFFDADTLEYYTTCVRDYDYSDCSRDNDKLYYLPIDKTAEKIWRRNWGIVSVGDTVEVYKGRKVPKGTVAKVTDIKEWRDCYGRTQTIYAYLDNGMRTSISNCAIIG